MQRCILSAAISAHMHVCRSMRMRSPPGPGVGVFSARQELSAARQSSSSNSQDVSAPSSSVDWL